MREPRSYLGEIQAFWPPLPVWRRLDLAVLATAIYTAFVVLVVSDSRIQLPDWGGISTFLNALVLGLLLGFRIQIAYDRWWEARRLWGQLVNDSRSLCTKAAATPGLSEAARAEVARLVPAFAVALKSRLRGLEGLQRIPGFEGVADKPAHVPLFLFNRLVAVFQAERTTGRITEMDLLLVDPHLRSLMDVTGACERIRNTPLPLSLHALLRHGLVLYVLTTPWLVADHLLWWSVLVVPLVGYFLLGIELTAEAVEEPFGHDADDLALTSYCETIRQSVEQILGGEAAS